MKITYSSNNSGGGWWLKDADWKALEKAGWYCVWGQFYFCGSDSSFNKKHPEGNQEKCDKGKSCNGHRRFNSWEDVEKHKGHYLGSLTKEASKDFSSVKEALLEFQEITGQTVMNEGCNCCGAPHRFEWEDGSCSGEECGVHLYGEDAKLSKEELIKKLQTK